MGQFVNAVWLRVAGWGERDRDHSDQRAAHRARRNRGWTMAVPATAAEDYVKVIYSHTEWQDQPISSSGLAALARARCQLGDARWCRSSSCRGSCGTSRMVPSSLTEAGEELALRMVRRHRLIETWLVEQFGYAWDEVHDEAEVLEHVVSDRMLDAIDRQLGHPLRDPHGDPIPRARRHGRASERAAARRRRARTVRRGAAHQRPRPVRAPAPGCGGHRCGHGRHRRPSALRSAPSCA